MVLINDKIDQIIEDFDPFDVALQFSRLEDICLKAFLALYKYPDFWKLSFQVLLNKNNLKSAYNLIDLRIDKPFFELIRKYFSLRSENFSDQSYFLYAMINGMFFNELYRTENSGKENILNNVRYIQSIFE